MRNDPAARTRRQEGAAERQAARAKLTDTQQLAKLEKAGHGEGKEAKRLRLAERKKRTEEPTK